MISSVHSHSTHPNRSWCTFIQRMFFCLFLVCFFGNRTSAQEIQNGDGVVTFLGKNTLTTEKSFPGAYVGSRPEDPMSMDDNSLIVKGKKAALKSQYELNVAQVGNRNSFSILHGASATSGSAMLGDTLADNNTIAVSGHGSKLKVNETFNSGGVESHDNATSVTDGGRFKAKDIILSYDASASGNSLTATGKGSKFEVGDVLIDGQAGSGSKVRIKKGASGEAKETVIGQDATALDSSMRVTGKGSSFKTDNLTIAKNGEGTFVIGNEASVKADQIYIAENTSSTAKINIGRKGKNETAGTLIASTINVGEGKAALNFNQSNDFELTSSITGNKKINVTQNGSGITIISGENEYSGKTDVNDGTIVAASQKALGTSKVNLNGGNLQLDTKLDAASVNWNSTDSTLKLSSDDTKLKTKHLNIADKNQTYYIDANIDDNNVHTLIRTKNSEDLKGVKFQLAGRSSDSYLLSLNKKGTKLKCQLLSSPNNMPNDTLDVGEDDEVVDSYRTRDVAFHSGSCLMVDHGSHLEIEGNFTGNSESDIIYEIGSSNEAPAINAHHVKLNGQKIHIKLNGQSLAVGDKVALLSTDTPEDKSANIDFMGHPEWRAVQTWVGDPVLYIGLAPASYAQMAQTPNQVNVGLALNSFIPATTGDQEVVKTALDNLTAAEYPNAFNQISPQLYSSLTTMAFNNVNAQNNELIQRLGNLRVAGIGFDTSGFNESPIINDNKNATKSEKDILVPSADNRWGVFVDGNGIFANVNIYNQLPGYSYESGGVTIGANYKWNETFSTGLYTGYQGSQSKQSGGNFICDNGSRFGGFGTYQQGGFFANALLGGDSHSYQINRSIQFPGINRTASSAPTAQELDTMLAIGHDTKINNFTFGPITSLQYTYFGVQPFTETGAQSLDLNVQSENANSLLYSLGSHVFYTWQASKNVLVVPQINMSWQHEFLQNPYAINSSLTGGGGVFNYTAIAPLRDALYTGVGVTVNLFKKYDASFFYNAYAGNPQLISQNFFASLGIKF